MSSIKTPMIEAHMCDDGRSIYGLFDHGGRHWRAEVREDEDRYNDEGVFLGQGNRIGIVAEADAAGAWLNNILFDNESIGDEPALVLDFSRWQGDNLAWWRSSSIRLTRA